MSNSHSLVEWEGSKENIAPLKAGRDPSKIVEGLKATESVNKKTIREFEDAIKNTEAEDPLKPWILYIKWIQQTLVSGGNKELVSVLERCTREFTESKQYKNDERYIRVWITYADICSDPLDIFEFMKKNKIGEYVALFYEAWAIYLENNAQYQLAEAAYELGERRNATPVERLRKHNAEFQMRMARRIRKQELLEAQNKSASSSDENSRAPLSKLTSKQAALSTRQGKTTTSGLSGTKQVGNQSNTSFQVFVDTDGAKDDDNTSGSWKKLPTEKEKHKENSMQPTSWVGQSLRSASKAPKPENVAPNFNIFIDEELNKSELSSSGSLDKQLPLRVQLEGSSDLRSNPLKNFKSGTQQTTQSVSQPKAPQSGQAKEVINCNMEALFLDGEEFSFEEIRAAKQPYFEEDLEEQDMMITTCIDTKIRGGKDGKTIDLRKYIQKANEEERQQTISVPQVAPTLVKPQTPVLAEVTPAPSGFAIFEDFVPTVKPKNEKKPFQDITAIKNAEPVPEVQKTQQGKTPNKTPNKNEARNFFADEESFTQAFEKQLIRPISTPSPAQETSKKYGMSNASPTVTINTKEALAAFYAAQASGNITGLLSVGQQSESPGFSQFEQPQQSKKEDFFIFDENGDDLKEFADSVFLTGNSKPMNKVTNGDIIKQTLGAVPKNENKSSESTFQIFEEEDLVTPNNKRTAPKSPTSSKLSSSKKSKIQTPGVTPKSAATTPGTFDISPLSTPSSGLSMSTISTATKSVSTASSYSANTSMCSFPSPSGSILSPSQSKKRTKSSSRKPLGQRAVEDDDMIDSSFQIDPFSQRSLLDVISKINPPLSTYDKFYDFHNKEAPSSAASLGVITDKSKKNQKQMDDQLLELDRLSVTIVQKIGSGAYANVYLVCPAETWQVLDYALKVQQPPCVWEFYMCSQVTKRVPKTMHNKYPKIASQHVYNNMSFLLMDYSERGTLQDAINALRMRGVKMEEPLAMFFTIEMMKIVETLHNAKIIHGDIKPDNFLMMMDETSDEFKNPWSPEGWENTGLKLIDFGRSIDLSLYPSGTLFKGDCHVDSFRCIEMQVGKPWTYQIDLFGIVAVAHLLLHGEYMESIKDEKTGRWRAKESFKRYWQADLWEEFFDAVLNVKDCKSIPSISYFKNKFQDYLVRDASKGRIIRDSVIRLNIAVYEYHVSKQK